MALAVQYGDLGAVLCSEMVTMQAWLLRSRASLASLQKIASHLNFTTNRLVLGSIVVVLLNIQTFLADFYWNANNLFSLIQAHLSLSVQQQSVSTNQQPDCQQFSTQRQSSAINPFTVRGQQPHQARFQVKKSLRDIINSNPRQLRNRNHQSPSQISQCLASTRTTTTNGLPRVKS